MRERARWVLVPTSVGRKCAVADAVSSSCEPPHKTGLLGSRIFDRTA